MNANIMMTNIFHKMEYDLKGQGGHIYLSTDVDQNFYEY